MFQGLPKANTRIILLKIEIFYNKNGLRFALSYKISEKNFYSNSYTGKLYTFRRPFLGSWELPSNKNPLICRKFCKRSPRAKIIFLAAGIKNFY